MMLLEYDNVWCACFPKDGAGNEAYAAIRKEVSYSDSRAFFAGVPAKRTLMRSGNRFPVGLLRYVIEKLRKQNHVYELVDVRPVSPEFTIRPWSDLTGFTPYDHQIEAVNAWLTEGKGSGILDVSTRSGKTVIAGMIAWCLGDVKSLIITSASLIHQFKRDIESKFTDFDGKIGIIGGGNFDPRQITVASIDSLYRSTSRNRKFLGTVHLVIYDECHNSTPKYQKVRERLFNARWRAGLSGTPFPPDRDKGYKLRTISLCGNTVYTVSMANVKEKGVIVGGKVIFLEITGDIGPLDWPETYTTGIVEYNTRNTLLAAASIIAARSGRKVLVLTEKLEHGKNLLNKISQHENCAFVWSRAKDGERREKQNMLEDGRISILIASRIFNIGVDLPFVDCVVNAGGYKSDALTIQKSSRPITRDEGKSEALVIDTWDTHHPKLEEHSMKRRSIYERMGIFDIIETMDIDDFKEKFGGTGK